MFLKLQFESNYWWNSIFDKERIAIFICQNTRLEIATMPNIFAQPAIYLMRYPLKKIVESVLMLGFFI